MAEKRLFASDIDGTLLVETRPDAPAVAAFRAWRDAHPELVLAYVTGRSHASALAVTAAAGLPRPDVVVASVGADVRWWRDGAWVEDTSWATRLADALGDRALDTADPDVLAIDGCVLQEPTEQSRFKRSYRRTRAAFDARIVEDVLERAGLVANAIASVDPRTGDGLLDLLPRGADKGSALEHLRTSLDLPEDAVAFAGDSGNDLAALDGPWWSIVVGNAAPVVKERFAPGLDRARRSVVAREDVLHGVLEGLGAIGWRSA